MTFVNYTDSAKSAYARAYPHRYTLNGEPITIANFISNYSLNGEPITIANFISNYSLVLKIDADAIARMNPGDEIRFDRDNGGGRTSVEVLRCEAILKPLPEEWLAELEVRASPVEEFGADEVLPLIAEVRRLREVLEAVEFPEDRHGAYENACAICGTEQSARKQLHEPDCVVGIALGRTRHA